MGMQQLYGIALQVSCDTKVVLEKVRHNRAEHRRIVQEAREGYVQKAKVILEEKLAKINEGKIVDLHINLKPPVDHTKEYDTIIQMLTLHVEPTISLGPQEVQNFIQDQWAWTDEFVMTNAVYTNSLRV